MTARVRDERERLQRLAEAHVVGEDPAQSGLPQVGQPAEAVELVGAELRLDADGVHVGQRLERAEGPGRGDELRGLLVDMDVGESDMAQGAGCREAAHAGTDDCN